MKTGALLAWSLVAWFVAAPGARASTAFPPSSPLTPVSAVIWVRLNSPAKVSRLQPGSSLEGKLDRTAYWRDQELFPAGSVARLVVGLIEDRKQKALSDDRPFLIRMVAPKRQRFATFSQASVTLPDGLEIPLNASFVALTRMAEVHAAGKGPLNRGPALVLVLQVEFAGAPFSALATAPHPLETRSFAMLAQDGSDHSAGLDRSARTEPIRRASADQVPATIPVGTHASVVLLQGLSASRNHPGDSFEARLLEPVRLGSGVVLPEGSLFEGVVSNRTVPRRLSRSAALHLTFTRLTLPGGREASIDATPSAAQVDGGSRMKMDAEGVLRGGSPGKARWLLDLGVTAGFAKVTDDSTQFIVELLVSSATDVSTAGVARIVAAGVSGLFLVTRHGRDVVLPSYTRMELTFTRAASLGAVTDIEGGSS